MSLASIFPGFSVGLGLRRGMADALFEAPSTAFDFVELAPENFLGFGGKRRRLLERARERWPLLAHGLALSVGGCDTLDAAYLESLGRFLEEIETPHYSDHLCVSSAGGRHSHELLPLPLTRETARHTARRVRDIASAFPVPFAVEHISAYARWPEDELEEPDFIREIVEASGCGLLLDVNNLYVNARNFGLDPEKMLQRMPLEATLQIHVAGHTVRGDGLRIDTHSEAIVAEVYALLRAALPRTGRVPVLIERDDNFPPLGELLAEVAEIRKIGEEVFGGG